ncbi:MAG: hypothetical protein ABUS48_07195 [Pseudomonadota bacterium]
MKAGLRTAEIDQLVSVLERAEAEHAGWRPQFEALNADLDRGRTVRDLGLSLIGVAALIFYLIHFGSALSNAHWDYRILSDIRSPTHQDVQNFYLIALCLWLLWWYTAAELFPILRREENVAGLLRYFGAAVRSSEGGDPEASPPLLMDALHALETSNSPTHLGGAYKIVFDWCHARPKRWSVLSAAAALAWLAIYAPMMLAYLQTLPAFWSGVLATLMATALFWRLGKIFRATSFEKRAAVALARWRHLVPAMRELP